MNLEDFSEELIESLSDIYPSLCFNYKIINSDITSRQLYSKMYANGKYLFSYDCYYVNGCSDTKHVIKNEIIHKIIRDAFEFNIFVYDFCKYE